MDKGIELECEFDFMVSSNDLLHVAEIVKQAYTFACPPPKLRFQVQTHDTFYNVIISGYVDTIDIMKFYQTFMGENRNPLFSVITHCYANMIGTVHFVLQVQKVVL